MSFAFKQTTGCLSWWIHTPVWPDSICNRVTPAIRFVIMALIISSFSLLKIPCQSVMQLSQCRACCQRDNNTFFFKLLQSRATLDLCPKGCQFFYSSPLLHTESRWSWLRAELNLVYVTVFLVGRSAKSIHTWIPLLAFTLSRHNILLLFMSQPDLYICCSCALISHPASLFFLIRISLAATEGNKMLLLWKPLPERQFMRLPACRQKPIYGRFLSEHPQMGPALCEHGAFNQTDGVRDRLKKRQQIERKMDGVETDD